jgi:hypothetical protein
MASCFTNHLDQNYFEDGVFWCFPCWQLDAYISGVDLGFQREVLHPVMKFGFEFGVILSINFILASIEHM